MRYMGGKWRQGRAIAEAIAKLSQSRPNRVYYEPFCGAMGSAYHVLKSPAVKVRGAVLSDVSEALICMWSALLNGWEPPDVITEIEYNQLKGIRDPKDPVTAYAGFGLSFGGQWWGTYARDKRGERDFPAELKRGVRLKASVLLKASDYHDVFDVGQIFYLDPPYHPNAGRSKCHNFDGRTFNTADFWDYARTLIGLDNDVIVTGFDAPADFHSIHCWGDTVVRHYATKGSDGTKEHIYMHESRVPAYLTL